MIQAELRQGVIVPLVPLPTEWKDGALLEISNADVTTLDIDAWAETMNQLCADSLVEDEVTMRRAIDEHRREAKGFVSS